MLFKYKAYTKKGELVEGSYEANSQQEVTSMLKEKQYMPVSVEYDASASNNIELFKPRVKKKDLVIFCRQFYTMMNSGISVVRTLDILQDQTQNSTLKKAIYEVYEDVQKGDNLSKAMGEHPNVFPNILVHMVEAGEVSGNLDSIMDRMATSFEKEQKIESKVKSSMAYPTALAVISIGVVIFMLIFVLPTFVGMFAGNEDALPGPTKMLIAMSESLQTYWYIYGGGVIVAFLAFNAYRRSEGGRYQIDMFKLSAPVLKDTTVKTLTARFTRTVATLMSSGITLLQALELTNSLIGNVVMEQRLDQSVEDIRKGVALSRALKNVGLFPPMVHSMVKIGEESGALDDMLMKTAEFYDEEVEVSLGKLVSLIEPMMMVIMAVVVGFIVLAMALPMFESMNTV